MVKQSQKAKGHMFIHLKLLLIREQGCVLVIQLTWTQFILLTDKM